jgi:hypothetical protein
VRSRRVVGWLLLSFVAATGACAVGSDENVGENDAGDAATVPAEAGTDTSIPIPDDASGDDGATDALDPPPPTHPDAGKDAHDSATDSATDAGSDSATDSASDAGSDSATDAGSDSATDAGSDSGSDAGSDAGSDSGPPPTVMVVRVGDGASALSAASTPLFLEERSAVDGALVRTIALPIAAAGANSPFTVSGTASSEGALALSTDGHFVTLGGYATTPGTAGVSGTTATAVHRAVARVAAPGTIDTSTLLADAFSGDSVRAAITADGTAFWVSGNGNGTTNGGIQHAALGSTATPVQVLATPSNTRVAGVWSGQLFTTSGSAGFDAVSSVGTGTPATAGQTAARLTGTGGSPYGFVVLDRSAAVAGIDTIYVADDRAAAAGGGIQKWTSNGTVWSLATTLNAGLTTTGVRGLAAFPSQTKVRLVATTAESPARLVAYDDDGTASPPVSVLATAATDTVFRGVAVAPK